jgi:hypothetical protein
MRGMWDRDSEQKHHSKQSERINVKIKVRNQPDQRFIVLLVTFSIGPLRCEANLLVKTSESKNVEDNVTQGPNKTVAKHDKTKNSSKPENKTSLEAQEAEQCSTEESLWSLPSCLQQHQLVWLLE